MDRPVGWPKALRHFAAEMNGQPFVWGDTDCVSVTRRGTELVVGRDLFDFAYATERGAKRTRKRLGGVVAALEQAGAVEVAATYAMQGDVVVNPDPDVDVEEVALVVGTGILGSTIERGVFWRSGIPRWRCFRLPGGSRVGVDG